MHRPLKRALCLAVFLLALSAVSAVAGQMCDEAERFLWQSWALNSHCVIETLWDLIT